MNKDYETSNRGIPILSLERKIDALKTCIEGGADEDAIGHIFDLLAHVITYDAEDLLVLHNHYGTHPTPLATPRMDSAELEKILFGVIEAEKVPSCGPQQPTDIGEALQIAQLHVTIAAEKLNQALKPYAKRAPQILESYSNKSLSDRVKLANTIMALLQIPPLSNPKLPNPYKPEF